MSRSSNVLDSLYRRRSSSPDADDSEETPAVDRETIAAAVREAVAEHERTYHDRDSTADEDLDEAERSSTSGRSPLGLLAGAATLALLGYFARKRRRRSDDDGHDTTHRDGSADADDR